jgi:DNA invertase Pin-like site-specific DNA recombinase
VTAVAAPRDNPGVINRRAGYPEEFRQRVRQAHQEEKHFKTNNEIAAEFGISLSALREWVGPDPKWKAARKQYHLNIAKVREMHWDGNTYHHIARVTGIPVSTVWDYINRPEKYANH